MAFLFFRKIFSACKSSHLAYFTYYRSILSELFKGVSKDSVAMVTGNLLHQVFQGVIVKWAESCKRKGHTREGVGVAKNDIDKTVKNVLSNGEALNQL